jgi:hypothetical protein
MAAARPILGGPFTAAFYARARARAHNLRYRAWASAQVKHHAVYQSPYVSSGAQPQGRPAGRPMDFV